MAWEIVKAYFLIIAILLSGGLLIVGLIYLLLFPLYLRDVVKEVSRKPWWVKLIVGLVILQILGWILGILGVGR